MVCVDAHGYEISGIGPCLGKSSWAQASVFSGLLAAMCHERCVPQNDLDCTQAEELVQRWLGMAATRLHDGTRWTDPCRRHMLSTELSAYPKPCSPINAAFSTSFRLESAPRLVTSRFSMRLITALSPERPHILHVSNVRLDCRY